MSAGPFWIGVDIGGTKTAVVLSLTPPAVVERIEFPTLPAQGPERAIALIQQSIHQLIQTADGDRTRLAGIGVSCGGPLDAAKGIVQAPPNLPTWVDVPITSILSHEFGVGCRIENDANAGAIAEHRFGAGKGTAHMVFLTMGTGLGAGVICAGKLLNGASGQAGEIGHVRLTPDGPVGYHKAGSVEGWASGAGMALVAEREAKAAIERGVQSPLCALLQRQEAITAKDVAEAAHAGDELSRSIIRETGTRLGEALAILVDILNPERIVVGGLGPRLGDALLGPARAKMCAEALSASAAVCEVVPAELGESIGDVAALCVAMGF
jgi:glucokinase